MSSINLAKINFRWQDIQGYVKISLVKIRFLIEQSKNIYLIGKSRDLKWL